ncbi:hypothetical protein KHQ81_12335 [Mycoplasmatota bacterium]|nr:hypothetical protein KHQ81_12335 [Mycoplasmatota bacterium]
MICSIESIEPIEPVGIIVCSFAVILLLSIICTWYKERIGGYILTICSVFYAVFIYITAGSNKILASVLISFPFLLSGILFILASRDE